VRVAVTGAGGRLGRALIAALGDAAFSGPGGPIAWRRPTFDLDDPTRIPELLDAERPDAIVHAAAWTDVDGCARDPGLAMARNGEATAALAGACAERGLDFVVISTNEVFDGDHVDPDGHPPDEPPRPGNAYGRSKLAGEAAAIEAYRAAGAPAPGPFVWLDQAPPRHPQLAIVRTAWLFGPPGHDFPDRIVAAAERAATAGTALRVVIDEVGQPTATTDLAEAITELLAAGSLHGLHHLTGSGHASRADWAREVLRRLGPDVPLEGIRLDELDRPSRPPRWGVLLPTRLPTGEPMPDWRDAFGRDLPWRLRARTAGGVG